MARQGPEKTHSPFPSMKVVTSKAPLSERGKEGTFRRNTNNTGGGRIQGSEKREDELFALRRGGPKRVGEKLRLGKQNS